MPAAFVGTLDGIVPGDAMNIRLPLLKSFTRAVSSALLAVGRYVSVQMFDPVICCIATPSPYDRAS